jgi:hypothetical protein
MPYAEPGPDGAPSTPPLRWPAPGLEPLHAAAWSHIPPLAIGAAVLALTLLGSIVVPRPFWSASPFSSAWWIPLVAAVLGLGLFVRGLAGLAALLRDAARATALGYPAGIIAWTTTDYGRDAGFLLQGARQYAELPTPVRRRLLNLRVAGATAYCAAGIWVPAAIAAGVAAAARGVLPDATALLAFVLGPAAVLLLTGVGCRAVEGAATSTASRDWWRRGSAERALRSEAAAWQAGYRELSEATSQTSVGAAGRRIAGTRALAWSMAGLAVLLPIPLVTVSLASATGPALAHVMAPRHHVIAMRTARAAVLQPFVLPADSGITAQQAGEALQALAWVGRHPDRALPLERRPVRHYADAWEGGMERPASLEPFETVAPLLIGRSRRIAAEERRYLEQTAQHAAHAELRTLARAQTIDVAGTRWVDDLPSQATLYDLPMPRAAAIREAALHHIALAVLQASDGDIVQAETTLREVISAGLLLTRDGLLLTDMFVGGAIADAGATALTALYDVVGRRREADGIRLARTGLEAMGAASRAIHNGGGRRTGPGELMATLQNETLPRSVRWESFVQLQAVAGCINPHTAVFGPDRSYTNWVEDSRAALVSRDSEEALFAAALNGIGAGARDSRRADLVRGMAALTLGRSTDANSCASVLGSIASVY